MSAPAASSPASSTPAASGDLSGKWSGQYGGAFTGTFNRELVTSALQSETLVWRGTAWTLTREPPISSGLHDLVASRLAALPETQRSALETIATGEPLPLPVALDLISESVLDELDAARLISVRAGLAGPEVSTAHPLHGEVLRADISSLRLRRLRLMLASKLESGGSPHDLVRAALWRLDSGQTDEPERLLAAARAARSISLDTAERLARRAHEMTGSLQATLLLAEILTNSGRSDEAAKLTAPLPPESLTKVDQEALVYCAAIGQGLLTGDAGGGADVVAGVLAGSQTASEQLQGLYASLLAFDGRSHEALEVAAPLLDDAATLPAARTLAAIGAVGAEYWLGHTGRTVNMADTVAPIAATVRDVLPFGAASIELLATCALLDDGDFDRAERRARLMQKQSVADRDPFSGPRADYALARIDLARGRAATALLGFRRCLAALTPFDQSFVRHISSMLARSATAIGDLATARRVLQDCADAPRMKTYEPEFELAVAALRAAELRLAEAADHAAWAAGLAADHELWNVALAGYHDAARYGAAKTILIPLREAATHVEGTLAWCLIDHAAALAARDPIALDEVARRFDACGAILFAAEASDEATLAHTAAGHARQARASATRAATHWSRCEGATAPWLAGAPVAVPLTARERQVAALAAAGKSDGAIADQLSISMRTVQTHLTRVYSKLGITGRTQLGQHLHLDRQPRPSY